jgi:hypothetical protein
VAIGGLLGFVALYLGGYPWAIAHERMGLVPLMAGLWAVVLEGYRRGNFSRRATAVWLTLLAIWAVYLFFSR